jgi:chemotaxis protein CheD
MKLPDSSGLPIVNLRPGELFVAREPTIITTLLGSCISVCLFNAKARMGAMCHGVLPFLKRSSQKDSDCFHFVDSSVAYMVNVLAAQQKTENSQLEAKLFGGANVIAITGGSPGNINGTVGAQNIEAARAALRNHGVPIAVQRVGGERGCKLFFYSHTGEVFLRSLSRPAFAGAGNGRKK